MWDGCKGCSIITSLCKTFSECIMSIFAYIATLPFFVQPCLFLFVGFTLFLFWFFGFFFFVVFSPIWVYIFCLYETIYYLLARGTNTQPVYEGEVIENNECGICLIVKGTCSFINEHTEHVSHKIDKLPCVVQPIMRLFVFIILFFFWLLYFIASPVWIFIYILFTVFYYVWAACTNTTPEYGEEVQHKPEKQTVVKVEKDINQRLLENEN